MNVANRKKQYHILLWISPCTEIYKVSQIESYWKYEIFKIYMKKPVGITIHVQKNTKFNCKTFTKIKNKGKWKFYKVNIFERQNMFIFSCKLEFIAYFHCLPPGSSYGIQGRLNVKFDNFLCKKIMFWKVSKP